MTRLLILGAGLVEDALVGRRRLGEQLRAGDAARRAAAEQVWLQRRETVVLHRHRLGHHLGDAALPLPGEPAVLLARCPILDVEVDRPLLRLLPALPRVEAAKDVV